MFRSFAMICSEMIALFFLSVFLGAACTRERERRNIESYYFPLNKMADGRVYEYQPVNEGTDAPMYWYYKAIREDKKLYLIGTGYDHELQPNQFIREKRTQNGMLLVDFASYQTTEDGKKNVFQGEISAGNVFPFEVKKPYGVLLTSVTWQQGDTASITLVKNRQFDGDTVVLFQGKKIPAVRFHTIELVDQVSEGHLELEFSGQEIYAKNIGLVYFKKHINPQWRMEYRLADIYPMEVFEKKFRKLNFEQ